MFPLVDKGFSSWTDLPDCVVERMIGCMFEGDLDELGTADLLAAASEFDLVEERAAVRKLEAALAYADRNAVVYGGADGAPLPGTERLRVYGGDGCPGVAEFAPIEFGAVMRMSTGAAASFMGEALALRHRLPRIWAAVLAGNAVPWRARKVARACLSLSVEAAAIVDRRVVGIVNTVTPSKLATIVKAAVWEADPELAKAQAEAAARERGVFVGPSDDHGTKRFWVRAAAGDVIRFDATIDDLARALKTLGDTDSLDARRAKAVGWIADPAAAHHLLEVARYLARILPHISNSDDAATTHDGSDSATDRCTAGDLAEPTGRTDATDHPVAEESAGAGDRAGEHVDPGHSTAGTRTPPLAADGGPGPAGDRGPDDWHLVPEPPDPGNDPGPDDWHDQDNQDNQDDQDDQGTFGGTGVSGAAGGGGDVDAFTRGMLAGSLPARLAAIKQHAYSHGLGAGSGRQGNRHTLYVHLTDKALAAGDGVLRVEELGPLLLSQLGELLGHDQIVVKPVIDLRDQVSVHSYEIPERIRERARLRHPVDMFPYGAAEATTRMDLDHIVAYERAGPPGQTSTDNLIPQGRLHHRAKTFGGWRCRRLPTGAIEWTSPHGFRFHVDHTGTHPMPPINAADRNKPPKLSGHRDHRGGGEGGFGGAAGWFDG